MRTSAVVLTCIGLLGIGCQSTLRQQAPATTTGERASYAAEASAHDSATPVAGRIDDDADFVDPTAPVVNALLFPFTAVGDLAEIPVAQMKFIEGDTPARAARMTLDNSSPDHRREGVMKLVTYQFAHRPPYTTRYQQMAQVDEDSTVRAAAIRASNRARDHGATGTFIAGLSDKSELVRLEAAKALANLPDPRAAAPLLTVAANPDEDRDVRIAATDALKHYRTLEVGRGLSQLLADRDFSVVWQARRSLVHLTHKNFGYDEGRWLDYLAGPGKPLG